MKIWMTFLALSYGFYSTAYAAEALMTAGQHDVIAPSIPGNPSSGDRIVGQIYYDTVAGSFKGVNVEGNIDTLSVAGANAVTSGGNEKIERASLYVANSSSNVQSQSGSWISIANGASAGQATITVTGFSGAPTCTCTHVENLKSCSVGAFTVASNTTATVYSWNSLTNANDNGVVSIHCMGARP